jgi:hypothetical protein
VSALELDGVEPEAPGNKLIPVSDHKIGPHDHVDTPPLVAALYAVVRTGDPFLLHVIVGVYVPAVETLVKDEYIVKSPALLEFPDIRKV